MVQSPEQQAHAARGLYLDLLLKCVANTIYCDPPQDPWSGGRYADAIRDTGRDWPSAAHTMIGVKRLQNLRNLCEQALSESIPGDVIETGVWRGGACILMRGILAAYGERDRKVYVADSFAGLPVADPKTYPADAGDTHHTFEQLAISLEEVKRNFERYGLLDDQCVFLKGWFKDTLPTLRDRTFALIRLDGDMYQSTMEALQNLYDRVSPGGFVIIDDYGAIPACRAAVEDFRKERRITAPLTEVDWTGVWWRKPR
jgi:SAM-dependent methyltransferase